MTLTRKKLLPTDEELKSVRSRYNLWFTNDDWQEMTIRLRKDSKEHDDRG